MKQESWLITYATAHIWRFVLIAVLGILTVLFAGALMFTSGYLISKSALRPENILMVYVPVVGVRTFGIGRAVIHYVERLVGHDTILRILSQMRLRLYNLLEPQALRLSSRYRTGDLLGVLAEDIERLQDVYIRTVFPAVTALVMYGGIVAALGVFDPGFAVLIALYVCLLVFVLPLISLLLTKRKNRAIKQQRSALYRKLTDAVLGLNEWFVSGRQEQFLRGYEEDEAEVDRTGRQLKRWARWRGLIAQGVVALTVISVLYWTGQRHGEGMLDVTLIAAFVLAVFPLMDAFLPLSDAVEKIPHYEESLARLRVIEAGNARGGLAGAAYDRESVENRNRSGMQHAAKLDLAKNARFLSDAGAGVHILVRDVSYRYEKESLSALATAEEEGLERETRDAVRGLSMDIPPGSKVAVIGRSGAGKSTLLKLLQGVISPSAGSVTLDGSPADHYGDGMASFISVLNQSPHLFDTTLENNIRLGRHDATAEEVDEAVRLARLGPLVQSLPAGLKTRMQEAGQRFSGGERQRVALARILLQNTPVVILDEPTVGLDPKTERDLLSTIFSSLHGRTLIWVTHHLVGIEQMDEIVFMDEGEITMRGTHAELLQRSSRYRRLYRLDRPGVM